MGARWKKLFVRTQASEDREPTIEAGSSLKGATTEVRRITTADDLFLAVARSEEHTSELQSRTYLVCRLLLGKKKV